MKYKYNGQWYDLTVPAFDSLPVGAIVGWTGTTIPSNYLLCNGQAVSRTQYATLFSVIETTYGSGDGSTTFNVPNLKGRVPVGRDTQQTEFDTLGETGGEKKHTIQWDELSNNVIDTTNTGSNTDGYIMRGGYSSTGTYNIGGKSEGTSLLQPYIVVNYIIKASPSAVNTSEVVNEYSTSETNVYSANYVNNQLSGKQPLVNYSTSEVDTGEKWTDGKNIYKKSVSITVTSHNNIDINNFVSNIDRVIEFTGGAVANEFTYPFYYKGDNDCFIAILNGNNTNLNIQVGSSYPATPFKASITMRYTKSS